MSEEATAIEIKSPEIAKVITLIEPTLGELDYEKDLHGNFFMVGWPEAGKFAVVPPLAVLEHWDHIEGGHFRDIKLLTIVR